MTKSTVQEILRLKIDRLVENEKRFEFPDYMRLIRKTTGFSRQFVADSIGCSVTKILYMEKGDYGIRGPDYEFIVTMSHFYGLNGSSMLGKFKKYMEKRNKSKKLNKLSDNCIQLELANANSS